MSCPEGVDGCLCEGKMCFSDSYDLHRAIKLVYPSEHVWVKWGPTDLERRLGAAWKVIKTSDIKKCKDNIHKMFGIYPAYTEEEFEKCKIALKRHMIGVRIFLDSGFRPEKGIKFNQ